MNNFQNKLQELLEVSENQNLNMLCRTYLSIFEKQNFKDVDELISDFVAESTKLDLDTNLKSKILADFKVFALKDLGIRESYDTIMEDCELVSETVYKERMRFVKNLFESNDDYIVIQKVLETYKTFPKDLVIDEQIQKLEESLTKFQDDIQVLNFITLLESSKDFPQTKKSCIASLKNYLANPNGATRIEVLENLKTLGYKPEVKDFQNYLSALNFADDSYNHSTHYNGSLSTGRIMDSYMSKWHGAKTKAGISGIVYESLSEIEEMSKSIPNRFVGKLLVEKLENERLNSVDKKIFTQIKEDMGMIDMGVYECLNRISRTPIGSIPDFKVFKQRINEQQDSNVPDFKLIDEVYNKISAYSYDTIVLDEMKKLSENFNKFEEKINLTKIIEYVTANPRNGLYENLKNDLISYSENPSKLLKNHIIEQHSKIAFEVPIKEFLNYFKQNTINEGSSQIVNSNVKDFNISKVYSFYELIEEGECFRINGKNIIKRHNDLKIVSDKKASSKVVELSNIFENLRMSIISENKITGFINNRKFDIVVNENENGEPVKELYVDDKKIQNVSEAHFLNVYTVAMGGNINAVKDLFKIFENIESFVEVDFAQKIAYKKNPSISAYFMNCNENFYVNLVNENLKYSKFIKTSKISTLRNALYEYMEFDISESFQELMSKEKHELYILKENAQNNFNKINSYEQKLQKLQNAIPSVQNQEIREQMYSLCESIEEEIEALKDEYRDSVEKIDDMEEVKGIFNVGSRVKCKETDKVGIVTSSTNSENCTVEFEDGTMENYLCTDLELVSSKEESGDIEEESDEEIEKSGSESDSIQYDANKKIGESFVNKKKV